MVRTRPSGAFAEEAETSLALRIALLILSLGLASHLSPVRAQLQNDALGFTPMHVFDSSLAGETVDMLSGNLSFAVPLGPRYQVTSDLGYQVTLSYNSKLWDHDCRGANYWNTWCDGRIITTDTYGVFLSEMFLVVEG